MTTRKTAPTCFGKYGEIDPGLCFESCPRETQAACRQAAFLASLRALRRPRIPSYNRPLLRLGYPAGVLVE